LISEKDYIEHDQRCKFKVKQTKFIQKRRKILSPIIVEPQKEEAPKRPKPKLSMPKQTKFQKLREAREKSQLKNKLLFGVKGKMFNIKSKIEDIVADKDECNEFLKKWKAMKHKISNRYKDNKSKKTNH